MAQMHHMLQELEHAMSTNREHEAHSAATRSCGQPGAWGSRKHWVHILLDTSMVIRACKACVSAASGVFLADMAALPIHPRESIRACCLPVVSYVNIDSADVVLRCSHTHARSGYCAMQQGRCPDHSPADY